MLEIANSLQQFMLGTIGVIPSQELKSVRMKRVWIADRLELAFKGINKRNFQYTFKMIPKSGKSRGYKRYVFAFKSNMYQNLLVGIEEDEDF